jgi:hypothetical protein
MRSALDYPQNGQSILRSECVDYLNVEQLTQRIFGNTQHAKRIQSISGAALGVLSSSSLIIHRIGQGLARENNLIPKHAIKQPKGSYWSKSTNS